MPRLSDLIATLTVDKVRVSGKAAQKTLNKQLSQKFSRPELTLKNRLKTTVNIANERNNTSIPITSEKDIFAGWCGELNKTPKTDCFELQPINKVKEKNDLDDAIKEFKEFEHAQWLKEVDAKLKNRGFKF